MPPAKKRAALIVDDDPTLRYVLARLARLAGYDILEANDADTALAHAARTLPDVVVADIRLPDFDGFELCSRLKTAKTTKGIPVLLVTSMYYESASSATSIAAGKKRAKEAGALDLLPRGEAVEKLGECLKKLGTKKIHAKNVVKSTLTAKKK